MKYKLSDSMKTISIVLAAFLIFSNAYSQNEVEKVVVPLIGQKAPSFKAETTKGDLNFPKDWSKSWKILFSHPADFTPVCTSEILELASLTGDLRSMDVQFAVLSSDNLERHKYWVESMQEIDYQGKGLQVIDFPLIADPSGNVSKQYGMIHPESGSTKDVRGVFIIDPKNTIRSIFFYPKETGRNMNEIKRTVLALQKYDSEEVYTPANWDPGEDVIVPFLQYSPSYNAEKAKEKNGDVYEVAWYLYMKKDQAVASGTQE